MLQYAYRSGGQVVRRESAKLLFAGSIPARISHCSIHSLIDASSPLLQARYPIREDDISESNSSQRLTHGVFLGSVIMHGNLIMHADSHLGLKSL